jgi:hypothetical protein
MLLRSLLFRQNKLRLIGIDHHYRWSGSTSSRPVQRIVCLFVEIFETFLLRWKLQQKQNINLAMRSIQSHKKRNKHMQNLLVLIRNGNRTYLASTWCWSKNGIISTTMMNNSWWWLT